MKENMQIENQVEITSEDMASDLAFADMVAYNEMADQTAVKINLIQQIHQQLDQLDELSNKRQFMLKEILQHIAD
ncbi:hypothetical protein [Pseudobdellovibrio exovorus]|uniref:Uncharacterized protein n=1 Tax=Pseudobdellovibrio exovorus JSS TaxID=1184267 RepID=M4V8Y5_9BACT|nr:hypothetical protein [Pseudobdellovibrio exovorus]AGH95867.1 hypothetical protein A11Q_1651 [Pseudobdellovibrio exovorus JSS]